MKSKSGQPDSSSGIVLLCNKQLSKVPDDIPDSPVYLDFSTNNIKNLNFPKDYNTLISLHLNENPLNKLDNIRFNNLRSLSLDFCNLNSMKQIPRLPNLISLSLVGNSLSNFEYFHIFPKLTKIDLRGNLVSFTAVHTIAAIGSLRLSTFNGRSITEQEFQEAFSFSPIVGHSLRKGRNPTPQNDEIAASISFLSKENPLDIKNIGGCLVIRCPIDETSNVKWYQSYSNEEEWELLDCTSRTLPVTPMMYQRLIKCEYGSRSFYTSDIIQKDGNGRNCLSFTEQPAIMGSGTIGSILSINSQQNFPTKINWRFSNSTESIGSCSVLIVPPEALGQKIIAEIIPFSPVFEKVQFAPITTEIQISNSHETELIRLSIPDTIIEGEPFEIDYETYPSNSKLHFTIDSSSSFESPYTTIADLKGKTTFTPGPSEVGRFLRVTTFVGDRQYSAYSKNPVEKVKATLKKTAICGENKTNHPHVFLFEFTDNLQPSGFSQRWFVDDGATKEYVSEDRVFVPSDECSSFTLGVDVTVWFDEDANIAHEQTFTIICDSPLQRAEKPIEEGESEVRNEAVEDSKITMSSNGRWMVSDINSENGFVSVGESDVYTPKAADIGKYIRFFSETSDVIFGPVVPSQSPIKKIQLTSSLSQPKSDTDEDNDSILNDLCVGSIVHAKLFFYSDRVEHSGDDIRVKWIRCGRGSPEVIVQEGLNDYVVTHEDVGSKIKVRVESADWTKDSELTPIIRRGEFKGQILRGKPQIGATLTLSFNEGNNDVQRSVRWFHNGENECLSESGSFTVKFIDVNHRIRVEVDGRYSELTDVVPPTSVEEGEVIKFADVFHRELTEKTGVLWFRYVFNESEWKEISARTSYKLKQADVNSVIRVVSYQIHGDGTKTSEIFADIGPITGKTTEGKSANANDIEIEEEEEENEEEEETNESQENQNQRKEIENKTSYDEEEYDEYDDNDNDNKKTSIRSQHINYHDNNNNNKNDIKYTNGSATNPETFDEYENEYEDYIEEEETNEYVSDSTKDNENENIRNDANEEEEEGLECRLQVTKYGQLIIVGDFGDDEEVKFFWRKWKGKHVDEIKDTGTRKLTPCSSMVGYEIDGGFQTATSVGIVWSNKVFIDHALPSPEATLDENGALVPGCILEVRTEPPPNYNPREQLLQLKRKQEQKHKKKHKNANSNSNDEDDEEIINDDDEDDGAGSDGEFDFEFPVDVSDEGEFQELSVRFVWKRWDGMRFSRIPNDVRVYKVSEEDTDCYVCCDIYYVDKDGNHGPHTSVETSGPVSSESVVIEGDSVVGSVMNAEGYDDFMKVCRFVWERSNEGFNAEEEDEDEDDEERWTVVGKKRTYRCTCDDIGRYVRVVCETKDERRVSHEVGPISGNEKIEEKANEIVKTGQFKFKTKEQNGVRWIVEASSQQLSISSSKGSRTAPWKNVEVRAAISSDKKVEVFIGSFRVSFVPMLHKSASEGEAVNDREVCILALRTMKERAMQAASNYRKK